MQSKGIGQGVVLLLMTAAAVWVVAQSADGWADWVVFGAIVATVYGAAIAVTKREYTTKKRTFVKSYDKPKARR